MTLVYLKKLQGLHLSPETTEDGKKRNSQCLTAVSPAADGLSGPLQSSSEVLKPIALFRELLIL